MIKDTCSDHHPHIHQVKMNNFEEYPEKHLNYYLSIISNCQSCDLYAEDDDMCLVEEKYIYDIVTSENPICPIGNW